MIRHAFAVVALATGALLALPAAANCTYPRAPTALPDGNTATMEEMVEGQKAVKAYMGEMDAYLKCLETQAPKADPATLSDEQKKEQDRVEQIRAQRHNAAVGEMEQVAERFNVQLRAFRAKQGKK